MCNFLDSPAFAFNAIGCSETWFTAQTDAHSFQIPGFILISDSRTHSIGGGGDYSDSKTMWDNINVIINKKRPSSYIQKLHVDD